MKPSRPAPLTELEIARALIPLAGWRHEREALVKDFVFADFRQALAWMVRAGFEAEELDHHPEWTNVYRTVTVRLSTHDVGGRVTSLDVELATRFEKITARA
jgi:4a-hydroxytetrahydrobiopterin dehydratase